MIKFSLSIVIILALVGGLVEFVATDESYALVVNKDNALYSIQNGAANIYEFFKTLAGDAEKIKDIDLPIDK